MKVHPSALKHGIRAEDAVQAADWALWIEPLSEDENPERELRLGFDTQARLLETVVLVFDSGDQMFIHAMLARKKYLDLLPGEPRTSRSTASPFRGAETRSWGDAVMALC